MSRQLRRLLEMPAAELAFRTRALLRVHQERLGATLAPRGWTRRDCDAVLHPSILQPPLRAALADGKWSQAGRLLRESLLRRGNRFVIDPGEARHLTHAIEERWPEAPTHAAQTGNAILAGTHQVLGYPAISFASAGADIDWHFDPVHQRRAPLRFWADVPFLDPSCGDHKIIWEINRQQYLVALGRAYWLTRDRRYAARIAADISGWLDANPPLVGINWASMLELALRSLSWTAATHFLLADVVAPPSAPIADPAPDDAWLLDVFVGLDRQLTHVERHLSRYFSPNTHLTGEALALYVVGVAFPELAGSERWTRTGKSILLDEIATQINADGGHAELSTCYHRYTLDFYSLAAFTAELEGDAAAATRFRDAVDRLRQYMTAFADANGVVPAIGDDDGGKLWGLSARDPRDVRDSLALAAVLVEPPEPADVGGDFQDLPEETLWLAWSLRPSVRHRRRTTTRREERRHPGLVVHDLRDSGYVIAHTGRGDHVTFDVGPHGFRNGGHAHADALSITVSLAGRPFLVDPGTATYTMDAALRNRMRGTAAHNTLMVDERPSALPRGTFHWETRATAKLNVVRPNRHFLFAQGAHDGYAPTGHFRTIVHSDDSGWLIADLVDGAVGTIDLHWHFDPRWQVQAAVSDALLATEPAGARAWLLHEGGISSLMRGEDAGGWYSPRYGALQSTFSARIRYESNPGPIATWIGTATDASEPSLTRIPLQGGARAVAYRVIHGHGTTLTMVHPDYRREPHLTTCSGVTSDARGLQLTTRRDGGLSVALADGRQLFASGLHGIEMTCTEALADLYASIHEDVAELWTTAPPPALRLRFGGGWRPRRLRLNGRDTVGLSWGGSIDIAASLWSAPPAPARLTALSDINLLAHRTAGRRVDAVHPLVSEGHS